jgi:hypothetical protein
MIEVMEVLADSQEILSFLSSRVPVDGDHWAYAEPKKIHSSLQTLLAPAKDFYFPGHS